MAGLVLSHVGKTYDDGTRAVTDLSVAIDDGELLVLVGPSGCGKTTALRMVAGLETISEGEIRIGERVVNDIPPRDRDVAMVFQSYALYPHLSVRQNIGFGLKLRKTPKDELNRRVEQAAQMLGLSDHLDRKPRNLSGGQRQRVAMGRAVVRQPKAFLMDEPLSNLDAKLRVQMRAEIGRLQRDLKVTTIYVTHDQTEAMTLGDRVAVMKTGVLQQIAPPQELYDRPTNLFVAGFIGSPSMNFLGATLRQAAEGGWHLELGAHRLDVPSAVTAARPGLVGYRDGEVIVGIRPEDIEDAAIAGRVEGRSLPAVADLVEPLGADVIAYLTVDVPRPAGHEDFAELARDAGESPLVPAGATSLLVARLSPRSAVGGASGGGYQIVVTVDTERLHFFDPDTGSAIWDA
jgi:multiple sugar transport system ATP-binding protein